MTEATPQTEAELRGRIVAEARTWIGTKWHHEARVKGAGVDCAQFLIAVYSGVGLIPAFSTDHYPADWHLHRDEPRFLATLVDYCVGVAMPEPGDIIMFRFGRHAAHGAIYAGNNLIFHAWRDEGRVTVSDLSNSPLALRVHGYYRWKGF